MYTDLTKKIHNIVHEIKKNSEESNAPITQNIKEILGN